MSAHPWPTNGMRCHNRVTCRGVIRGLPLAFATAVLLADFIRAHTEPIIASWKQRVFPSADVSDRAIGQHLTAILDRVADYVAAEPTENCLCLDDLPKAHTVDRLLNGLDFGQVISEYSLLRQSILGSWDATTGAAIPVVELHKLDLAFDALIAQAAGRFARIRERLFQSVDRVTDAALASADVDVFLQDLLRVAIEATGTVHAAGVLLREENRLRLRAAVGLEDDVASGFSVAVGEGFAGRVADHRQPFLIHHAAEDPNTLSPTIRRKGVRGLYGVPMIQQGKVIGVAQFGSLTAVDFSEEDKLLFRTVVSRATAAVVKAQILADLRRAEGAQRFLAEASRRFAESLDYEATLDTIAQLAVPSIADWCVVDLVEDGRVRRVSVAHADPAQEPLANELKAGHPVDSSAAVGIGSVLRSGTTEWRGRLNDRELEAIARDPEHLALLRRLKLRAYVVVPILSKGVLLGTISLVTAESNRRYSESDVAVAEDLARRAAMAIENARLYAEARRAVHVREQVLATVSHDLRNQVNVVAIASELLLRTANLQDTAFGKPLAVIARTARSMKDLVNDLLDLASIQAGKLSLSAGPTPLASLVEEARDMHESAARAAGLRLTTDVIPHVDVFADRARVLQVLSNLLGNAIKFTPSGGAIAVRASATDAEVTISVVDTGRGIPAQDLATVFEPYRARGSGAGSGLGLFIAQGIVEGHDGRIWIDSREHAGTTVSFTLPRRESPYQDRLQGMH